MTSEEWDWAQSHPERRSYPLTRGLANHPVTNVNWDDAQAYCRWLRAVTGKPYRLLSEAEWEYCCRAGTDTPFWWGSSISIGRANYDDRRTVPVASFKANPWGLYQMHGNVWEWCEDVWRESYDGITRDDGSPLLSGDASRRAVRGGSWGSNPAYLRSACRDWYSLHDRYDILGFRVARTFLS